MVTDMGQVPALPLPGCVALSKRLHLSECKLNHPGCCEDLLRSRERGVPASSRLLGLITEHHVCSLCPSALSGCRVLPTTWHVGSVSLFLLAVPLPSSALQSTLDPAWAACSLAFTRQGSSLPIMGQKIALPPATSCNLACGLRSVVTGDLVFGRYTNVKGSRRSPVSRGRHLPRVTVKGRQC